MRVSEFKAKYGEHGAGLRLVIEEFIKRAPEFKGDSELAKMIGEGMADLEAVLRYSDAE